MKNEQALVDIIAELVLQVQGLRIALERLELRAEPNEDEHPKTEEDKDTVKECKAEHPHNADKDTVEECKAEHPHNADKDTVEECKAEHPHNADKDTVEECKAEHPHNAIPVPREAETDEDRDFAYRFHGLNFAPIYRSSVRRIDGEVIPLGFGYDGDKYMSSKGNVWDMTRPPPGRCFECNGNHWRKDCPLYRY